MKPKGIKQGQLTWIIGYGNCQRRDDGIGPYVANQLNIFLKNKKGVRILALNQLEPDLVNELRHANLIILVDATMDEAEGGWTWDKIEPELEILPHLTHYLRPSYLLGFLQSIYRICPPTWLVSVQGDDFEFGEELSRGAEKRAQRVVSEITEFILRKNIDNQKESVNIQK